jgi:HD domain
MQPDRVLLKFSEVERQLGDRLLKIASETDRIEGYSEPHAILVALLSEAMGEKMGMHGIDLTALKFAALSHDIGERAMKRNYLLRPGILSWEETLDLWRHPILGEQAAGELRLSRLTQLNIRWHHEWWNGLGYPDGLAGEAIPLGARILRVVDSYCALISNRPHRLRFDSLEAEQIIADLAGIEFDPMLVRLLLETLNEERQNIEHEIHERARETDLYPILTEEGLQTVVVEAEGDPVTLGVPPPEREAEDLAVEAIPDFGDDVSGEAETEPAIQPGSPQIAASEVSNIDDTSQIDAKAGEEKTDDYSTAVEAHDDESMPSEHPATKSEG